MSTDDDAIAARDPEIDEFGVAVTTGIVVCPSEASTPHGRDRVHEMIVDEVTNAAKVIEVNTNMADSEPDLLNSSTYSAGTVTH